MKIVAQVDNILIARIIVKGIVKGIFHDYILKVGDNIMFKGSPREMFAYICDDCSFGFGTIEQLLIQYNKWNCS